MSLLSQTRSYANAFAEMSPETIQDITSFLSEDVIFTDPFNEVHGHAAFKAIFDHMFAVMTDPRFEILDVSCSERAGYIKWRMTGALKAHARPSPLTLPVCQKLNSIKPALSQLIMIIGTAHISSWPDCRG